LKYLEENLSVDSMAEATWLRRCRKVF